MDDWRIKLPRKCAERHGSVSRASPNQSAQARKEKMTTLGEALPLEIARVRDEVLPAYLEIGVAGAFGVAMMRTDLDRASKAMIEGDTVAMFQVYESLKEYHV